MSALDADSGYPLLSGRFLVHRHLGSGAFGDVYAVWDSEQETEVAAKRLSGTDPVALLQFKQGFRLLTNVVHPNLVDLFELFSGEDGWFFTMALLDGEDFDEWLAKPATSERDTALCKAFLGMANGLAALHAANIVHCDVKPSNVRVTSSGEAVLLDFGLAQIPESSVAPGALRRLAGVGSPRYMAPEQWRSSPATSAADWYAFGLMLFEALEGRHPLGEHAGFLAPFEGFRPAVSAARRWTATREALAQLCESLLAYEPTDRPTDSEVVRRLSELAGAPPIARPPNAASVSPTMVGREANLAQLEAMFEQVERGGTALAQVVGPSGIGKTTVLNHFLDELRREGRASVFRGRCCERELIAYSGLDDVVDAVCEHALARQESTPAAGLPSDLPSLARLFPIAGLLLPGDSPPRGPEIERGETFRQAVDELSTMLASIAVERPVVVALDDVHWGDADGARLLGEMLLLAAPPRVLVLLAHDESPCNFLESFDRLTRAARWQIAPRMIRLHPLAERDAAALVRSRLASGLGADTDRVASIVAKGLGLPLALEGLADAASKVPAGATLTLELALTTHLNDISKAAWRILHILAVATRAVPHRALLAAADVPGTEGLAALEVLRARRVVEATTSSRSRVRGHENAFDISHHELRLNLVRRMPPAELAVCHQRLAGALERHGQPAPEVLVVHLAAAGETGAALTLALRAAKAADEAFAFARAADLYQAALDLLDRAPEAVSPAPSCERLDALLTDALVLSGRSAEAAKRLADRATRQAGSARLATEQLAIEHFLVSGRLEEGLSLVPIVLRNHGLNYPSSTWRAGAGLVRLLAGLKLAGGPRLALRARASTDAARYELRADACWAIGKALTDIKPIHALGFQLRSLLIAARRGDEARCARAMAGFGGLWVWQGTPRSVRIGAAYIERAASLPATAAAPTIVALVDVVRGALAFVRGEFDLALSSVAASRTLLDQPQHASLWESNMARLIELLALEATCRARELREQGDEWYREAAGRGDLFAQVTSTVTAILGTLADGDTAGARRRLAEAIARWPLGGSVQQFSTAPSLVMADLYDGDAASAWTHISSVWKPAKKAQLFRAAIIRIKFHVARASTALALMSDDRRRSRWEDLVQADCTALARELRRDAAPLGRALRAGVAWRRGAQSEALAELRRAEEEFAALGMDVHANAARLVRGQATGGDEGLEAVSTARGEMIWRGVREPERWAGVLVPGFARS